jgi:hypothetical protein
MSWLFYSSLVTYHAALVSSIRQHFHYTIMVRLGDEHVDIKLPFSLVGFLGQNMSRVGVPALDLAGSGNSEPFGCALVCF